MRKKLILCRHADAAAPLPGQRDIDRALTEAGKTQATQAGTWLKENAPLPDLVISSPAKRARQTTRYILDSLNLSRFTENLAVYEATDARLLSIVNAIPDSVEVALLVGHNPGISSFATKLTGVPVSFETGQVMVVKLEAESWSEVAGGTGST